MLRAPVMDLKLSDGQARELRTLVDNALGDSSIEIAATDNAEFRAGLGAGVGGKGYLVAGEHRAATG